MKRGFGAPGFDRAKQRAIAVLGGKAAHAKHVCHEWTVETAREAGRKGGSTPKRPRADSKDAPQP